ncbi:hypothetical protein MBRA1_002677 [Malassezia brasiliensis]|uniref:Uncharacterized protein n=1 Tax=Malassezia brasiliensis TaxID=1821822 RepID=A0AAF0DUJ6_9BASI|nr:hypothetical protein MBRA1_002677 [Malassezia brasiliensis]
MSAAPSAENPPPPPPRSRARRAPRATKDGSDGAEEVEEAPSAPGASDEPRERDERDERIEQLTQELDSVKAARDDLIERSSDWLQEREELRAHARDLVEKVKAEQERADAAEERVRELRRTAEESRRAIMRLSSSKAKAEAQRAEVEADMPRRPGSSLSSLTNRPLSALNFDDGEETRGLKGLRLSSGSSVTSPTPPAAETFGKDDDASTRNSATTTPADTPDLPQGEFAPRDEEPPTSNETVKGDEAATTSTHAPNAFTSMFGKSSLLRPTFSSLLRKPQSTAPAEASVPAPAPADGEEVVPETVSRADLERTQGELNELRMQFALLQDQLTESREAEQASEMLIRSLREYIVNSQGAGDKVTVAEAPAEADVAAEATVTETIAAPEAETGDVADAEPRADVDADAEPKADTEVSETKEEAAEEAAEEAGAKPDAATPDEAQEETGDDAASAADSS